MAGNGAECDVHSGETGLILQMERTGGGAAAPGKRRIFLAETPSKT